MLVTDEGPLRIVTIAKPECRNAVDPSTADNFRAAFEEFDRGDALSGAVLTGAGLNFCSGFDLRALGQAGRRWLLSSFELWTHRANCIE